MNSSSTSRLAITINPISLIEPKEKTTSDYFKGLIEIPEDLQNGLFDPDKIEQLTITCPITGRSGKIVYFEENEGICEGILNEYLGIKINAFAVEVFAVQDLFVNCILHEDKCEYFLSELMYYSSDKVYAAKTFKFRSRLPYKIKTMMDFKSVVIHALAHMYERFKSIAFDLHPKTWLSAANIELPELPECADDLPF
ncbi:hypothetical protein [Sphingobacterium siyangense]|uniref:hypothetical protein n=1 Tax=Sphingobacterium siyangense TaxID=459529 RepID=UPI003DA44307